MSANRHVSDLLDEAKRLDADLDTLLSALRAGNPVGLDDLAHIRRMTTVIRTHAAMAQHALTHQPPADRRVTVTPAMPPTLPQLLTPAQQAIDDYHDIGVEAASPITLRRLP